MPVPFDTCLRFLFQTYAGMDIGSGFFKCKGLLASKICRDHQDVNTKDACTAIVKLLLSHNKP